MQTKPKRSDYIHIFIVNYENVHIFPYMEPELSIVLVKLWGFIHSCDQDVGWGAFMPIYGDRVPAVMKFLEKF